MAVVLAFITLFLISNVQSMSIYETLWSDFKVQHGKSYVDHVEELLRKEIFRDNLDKITLHNLEADLGKHSFRLAVNKFADMVSLSFES